MKKLNSMVIEIMFVFYLNPNSNNYMRGTTLTSFDLGLRGSGADLGFRVSGPNVSQVAITWLLQEEGFQLEPFHPRNPHGFLFRWTSVSLISSKI